MQTIAFDREDLLILRAGRDDDSIALEIENHPQLCDRLRLVLTRDESLRLIEVLQSLQKPKPRVVNADQRPCLTLKETRLAGF